MLSKKQIKELTTLIPSNTVFTDPSECIAYSYDNSRHQAMPDAVVLAETQQQIIKLVRFCNQHKIPLTTRGRGTGTTGAAVPVSQGILLSLERMHKIKKIDPANRLMIVEPGITNQQVQDTAKEYGFFWGPDPSSAAYCTVGGNLACNAAGPHALKYGSCRDNTLGLSAITGDGDIIKTGTHTTKGVVGYDLTRLLIGSEGTLAIITEAILKLTPITETKTTLQAFYHSIQAATDAITKLMTQPIIPCALEFIDGAAINMIRDYAKLDLPLDAKAMLIIEIDGTKKHIHELQQQLYKIASNDGLLNIIAAQNDSEIQEIWRTRKALSPALRTVAPKKINEDVVVPVSNIPTLIHTLNKLSDKYKIPIINFGHAGNGNIHVNLLIDPDKQQQMQNAQACLNEVFDTVIKLDGTLSGEHGVGIEKRDFVSREIDKTTLALMHKIKNQFDPNRILNPGKSLPNIDDN